ncbi:MAG: sigma-54 dependent transcriptional regulator [Planctomycetaceae bacterium]
MDAPEFVVLCSSLPGFVRSIGGHLAGQCRLLECYSVQEAAQLVQLRQPIVVVVDLRRGGRQTIDRTWAMAQNSRRTSFVAVVNQGDVNRDTIPEELAGRVALVELAADETDLAKAAAVARQLLAGDSPTVCMSPPAAALHSFDDSPATGVRPVIANSDGSQPDSSDAKTTQPAVTDAGADASDPHAAPLPSIVERFRTRTPALRSMLQRLEVAARHDVTILLIGETGSGKTHLAGLIHEASHRAVAPFLTVACGALPADLIESELFGHVKGAFTSAHTDKDGKFLAAGRGTILLDEIDVLTPEQQVKLLRVIEKGEFEPVGSNRTIHVQARVIAASNRELQPLVETGCFRPDLYYRLNTLSFQIPPLRKRLPDIEPLVRYFVHRHAEKHNIDVVEISSEFLDTLIGYPWPGNVREMENAIRSAVIYSDGGRLTIDTLPPNIVKGAAGPGNDGSVATFFSGKRGESLGNCIELTEKDLIEQALLNNSFSRTKTAKQLGISRVTLYNKMKKYEMMPQK